MCVDVAVNDAFDKRQSGTRKTQLIIDAHIRREKDVPCADCGVKYPPYVMQFDHVRGEKEFGVGSYRKVTTSLDRVKAEIAKCEVVCANCHATRTYACQSFRPLGGPG